MIRIALVAIFAMFTSTAVKGQRLHCVECFERAIDGVRVMGNISADDIQTIRDVLGDRVMAPNYIFSIAERSVTEHIRLSHHWFPIKDVDADISVSVRSREAKRRSSLFLFQRDSGIWSLVQEVVVTSSH